MEFSKCTDERFFPDLSFFKKSNKPKYLTSHIKKIAYTNSISNFIFLYKCYFMLYFVKRKDSTHFFHNVKLYHQTWADFHHVSLICILIACIQHIRVSTLPPLFCVHSAYIAVKHQEFAVNLCCRGTQCIPTYQNNMVNNILWAILYYIFL